MYKTLFSQINISPELSFHKNQYFPGIIISPELLFFPEFYFLPELPFPLNFNFTGFTFSQLIRFIGS